MEFTRFWSTIAGAATFSVLERFLEQSLEDPKLEGSDKTCEGLLELNLQSKTCEDPK